MFDFMLITKLSHLTERNGVRSLKRYIFQNNVAITCPFIMMHVLL